MEQYIQCGDIAENPLYVKELGIHIYTAEEFCYYIFNNTYLLGEDFIRQEVIDFFRVELHMPELADKIVKFYGSSADMGALSGCRSEPHTQSALYQAKDLLFPCCALKDSDGSYGQAGFETAESGFLHSNQFHA